MRTNRTALFTFGAVTLSGLLAAACASSPPPRELLDARAAYARAQDSAAEKLQPAALQDAKIALGRAEQSYSDDGDSQQTRDLAYIAERRVELAEVRAGTTQAMQDAAQARARNEQKTVGELEQARQQLDEERKARAAAEQRARDALQNLSTVVAHVAVKNDTRGTIITIPGSVLFGSGKTDLLPGAQASLDKVADALKDQTNNSKIEVDGYTDSTGSEEKNREISKERADHVRDYLVSRGIPAASVESQGFGPSQPIADNTTNAGRAMNRRVEIVVKPQQQEEQQGSQSQQSPPPPPAAQGSTSPASQSNWLEGQQQQPSKH